MDSEQSLEHLQEEINLEEFQRVVYEDFEATLDQRVKNGIISLQEKYGLQADAKMRRDKAIKEAQEQSTTDPLTGLPNRRAFDAKYEELVNSKKPFGLILIDIDHFKKVNDDYGHKVGDNVLVQMGGLLSIGIRLRREGEPLMDTLARSGMAGRVGGEEFALVLPGLSSEENLRKVSERIRNIVATSAIKVSTDGKDTDLPVTISIGSGIYRTGDAKVFYEMVDKKALYQAKTSGRNKTVIYRSVNPILEQAA